MIAAAILDHLAGNEASIEYRYTFRLDQDGKIVEHWEVLQRTPSESANGNTML